MPPYFKHFKPSEIVGIDFYLVALLDLARDYCGVPFIITSGLRTIEENKKVDGKSDSAHLKGLAVDLRCNDGANRYKIVKSLLSVGIRRIGIETEHIHADIDTTLPQEVIWLGVSH